ncbi:sensor histidine kinase [Nocardia stercoris]|nr:sensor histidine kinase [Nocardia stercoris]
MWWAQPQLRPWTWYLLGNLVIGVAAELFLAPDLAPELPGLAVFVAIPLCCLLFGERVFHGHDRTVHDPDPYAVVFALTVTALQFLATALAPGVAFALPLLFPLLFMSLPLRFALVAAAIAGAGLPAAAIAGAGLPLVANFAGAVMPAGFVIVVSVMGAVLGPLIGALIIERVRVTDRQAELLAEVTASRAEVARLAHESGGLAERARLAGEIHDTLAQGFTSIITLAEAIDSELDAHPDRAREHLELLRATARENLAESRAMVAELTPPALADHSLGAALRRQCDRLAAETGLTVDVHSDPDLSALPTATGVVVLRSVQEAFANVRKHAHASRVAVRLDTGPELLRIVVCDNGIGFPAREPGDPVGYGLHGMRTRVEEVGGTVTVATAADTGTTVTIEVPA